jgi:hypothetical protein
MGNTQTKYNNLERKMKMGIVLQNFLEQNYQN